MRRILASLAILFAFASALTQVPIPASAQSGELAKIGCEPLLIAQTDPGLSLSLERSTGERQFYEMYDPCPPAVEISRTHIVQFTAAAAATIPVGATGAAGMVGRTQQALATSGGTLINTFDYSIRGFSADLTDDQAATLRANPDIATVRLANDVTTDAHGIQDLNDNPHLWGLDRIDQRDYPLDDTFSYDGQAPGIYVYVVDSGVAESGEFGDRLSGAAMAPNRSAFSDCLVHGSPIARIVGGATSGVAKRANIVSLNMYGQARVDDEIEDCMGTKWWALAAVDWANEHFIANGLESAVLNMSQGWSSFPDLEDALQTSIDLGIVVVTSAGNDGNNACLESPARMPEVITVGAINTADGRAAFTAGHSSNNGSCIDIWAPGKGILGHDGTSFAAPLVAGVAALILQTDPSLSPAEVEALVIQTSTQGRMPPQTINNRILYWDPQLVPLSRCTYTAAWWDGPRVPTQAGNVCQLEPVPAGADAAVHQNNYYIAPCPMAMQPDPGLSDCGLTFTIPRFTEAVMLDNETTLRFYLIPAELPSGDTTTPSCPDGFVRTVHIGDVSQCDGSLAPGATPDDYELTYTETTATLSLVGAAQCIAGTLDTLGCQLGQAPAMSFADIVDGMFVYVE